MAHSRQKVHFRFDDRRQRVRAVIYRGPRQRSVVNLCSFQQARIIGVSRKGEGRKAVVTPLYRTASDRRWSDTFLIQELTRARAKQLGQDSAQRALRSRLTVLLDGWIGAGIADRARGTIESYRLTARYLLRSLGDNSITEFTLEQADIFGHFLAKNGQSPATRALHLRNLRTFLNWCLSRKKLEAVPRIKIKGTKPRVPTAYRQRDLQRLLDHICRSYWAARDARRRRWLLNHQRLLIHAVGTGQREGEIASLELSQLDLERGTVAVLHKADFRTKEGEEKIRPMPAWLMDYWKRQIELHPGERFLLDDGGGRPGVQDPHVFTVAFARYKRRLAIGERVKPVHGLRAFFATYLRDLGASPHAIAGLLGHSAGKSRLPVEAYLADEWREWKEAIALLGERPPLDLSLVWEPPAGAEKQGQNWDNLPASPAVN